MRQYHKYFVFSFLAAISACSSGDETTIDIGLGYAPVKVGLYQIYGVDQTEYSELAGPVETHYELKTEVVDSFPNVSGVFTYVIHRSTRETSQDSWVYKDTWSLAVDDQQVLLNEENIAFVKMKFPLRNNRQWNGNEYNIGDPDIYEMKSVNEPFTVDDQTFPLTMFIDQEDVEDLLIRDRRLEVFAKDVGLVYKEVTDLTYCDDVDCFGQKEIKSGIIYKQSIISYGYN